MKVHLKILSVFTVMTGVLMKSGNVYEVTVGETVEIRCSYPEDHKYTPKYFCRHPCKSSEHVLIKSEKVDQVDSAGRYSLINIVNGLFFSVTIKHLKLTDSGVYYCGLDQWFRDTLKKVVLSVYPAPVNGSTHTSENTHVTSTWTTALTWTGTSTSLSDKSSPYEQVSAASPTVQSKGMTILDDFVSVPVVCAGVLVLLVFGVLVPLMSFWRKTDFKSTCLKSAVPETETVQDSPDLNQDSQTVYNVNHLYEEIVNEYSLSGPARDGDCSVVYSTVQPCDPASQNDENTLYSLITQH
ncbi:CMRF35-like molecule 1 [Puntigrus tetrazona]|uniref:CMRF35-like molecule 1 n=1 Tax=Puntigrus tetrazona TaxID=1606681 RepID=UPI001C893064|nr:CMRF35-like molecule 1 [Puntigrus tetrazona]